MATDPAVVEIVAIALVGAINEVTYDWLNSPQPQRPARSTLAYALTQLLISAAQIPPLPLETRPT